ncbi:hypothetical protein [Williamsia sp. D3]|uniref:hypothetical protein n=1 Tax=Williamsia sp. D3 TaxID=1313067 RepID=UPI0003D34CB3|nr:hypothetical protein [Williamsia sp. D3]ETD30866.1 hypothetical protein W823_22345 [Williamsia sp. D3]PZU02674.1 MAG: hypothetical protein DI630_07315 [Gordonia sp. (in: high G+C Gram-positive bacteria)]
MSLWEWFIWGAMLLATLTLIGVSAIFGWAVHRGCDTLSPKQGTRLTWTLLGSFFVAISASVTGILAGV